MADAGACFVSSKSAEVMTDALVESFTPVLSASLVAVTEF